jgi:AbrB family looped-hinge helix DNA binding protein
LRKISTTKMSSKGQVVIPEDIRDRLGLKPGDQFVVMGDKDVVILKTLTAPSMSEFDSIIKDARSQAREAGLKRSDIYKATKKARKKR